MKVELTRDQILALLDAIEVCLNEGLGQPQIYEAQFALQSASQLEDHVIMPDGHRLPDDRD
jgi:hypothetical protein